MKNIARSLVASILAFGLMIVGTQAFADHDVENDDSFLTEIFTDYDS